ncbi:ribose transport system permease protein, partial [Raineyella antarctica]
MGNGVDPWIAAVAGIVFGAFLGFNNALIVQLIRIPTIVATLATLSVYRGLALGLSQGRQVTGLPRNHPFFTIIGGKVLAIPVSVIILVLVIDLPRSSRTVGPLKMRVLLKVRPTCPCRVGDS